MIIVAHRGTFPRHSCMAWGVLPSSLARLLTARLDSSVTGDIVLQISPRHSESGSRGVGIGKLSWPSLCLQIKSRSPQANPLVQAKSITKRTGN